MLPRELIAALAVSLAVQCARSDSRPATPTPATAAGRQALDRANVSVAPVPRAPDAQEFTPAPHEPVKCVRDGAFPSLWKVPEASAAAQVQLRPGSDEILVVSDSFRNGAAMAWRAGAEPRPITLPLDANASDDMEGMAWLPEGTASHLYTLTSSGAIRRYVPDGSGGLRQDMDAYRIGAPPLSCGELRAFNCGKNWEGLCLRRATARARCAGYAASKTDTALYCVVRDDHGRLAIDPSRPPLALSLTRVWGREGVLSDCAFGAEGGPAEGVLLVTTNVFGGSITYIVDERTGQATPLDVMSTLSNEAVAVDSDGGLYAFMDDNGPTSVATHFFCTGWERWAPGK